MTMNLIRENTARELAEELQDGIEFLSPSMQQYLTKKGVIFMDEKQENQPIPVQIRDLRAEIQALKSVVDTNHDGRVSTQEIREFAEKSANALKEYFWMYLVLVLAVIGYYKPTIGDWETWRNIFTLALVLSSTIFGGYLKSTFQRQFADKERQMHEIEAERDALREALSKSAAVNESLKREIEFLKLRLPKETDA